MHDLACKEWACVVRALLAGEQILDLRKGGIHEDGRHFGLRAERFWLYPTLEHQRAELLKPAYRHWVTDELAEGVPSSRTVRIEGWAEVVGVTVTSEPEELAHLDSKFIWTRDYVESRLNWKRRDPLWILALRAHCLLEPLTVPWREDYGGCTSWVNVAGLPDPSSVPARPAVSEEALAARIGNAARDLGRSFEAPPLEV